MRKEAKGERMEIEKEGEGNWRTSVTRINERRVPNLPQFTKSTFAARSNDLIDLYRY